MCAGQVASWKLKPDEERCFRSSLVARLPALRRYATALVGSSSWADDLVQDTVERALRHAATLKDLNHPGAWLRLILHNLYLSELRRQKPASLIDLADTDDALIAPQKERSSVNEVSRAVSKMRVEHRQVLLLIGVEGLSYREVAQKSWRTN